MVGADDFRLYLVKPLVQPFHVRYKCLCRVQGSGIEIRFSVWDILATLGFRVQGLGSVLGIR